MILCVAICVYEIYIIHVFTVVKLVCFFCLSVSVMLFGFSRDLTAGQHIVSMSPRFFIHHDAYFNLFVSP